MQKTQEPGTASTAEWTVNNLTRNAGREVDRTRRQQESKSPQIDIQNHPNEQNSDDTAKTSLQNALPTAIFPTVFRHQPTHPRGGGPPPKFCRARELVPGVRLNPSVSQP
jgi:hypothetical protein